MGLRAGRGGAGRRGPGGLTRGRSPQVLDTLLLSTFTAWKAFFPLVQDSAEGSYTFITGGRGQPGAGRGAPRVAPATSHACLAGGAGERLLMPGTGFLTLGAAGALAFCRVLREEYPDVPCKLNEVSAALRPWARVQQRGRWSRRPPCSRAQRPPQAGRRGGDGLWLSRR